MLQPLELDRTLVAETDAQIREIETKISKLEEQVAALKGSISVLHAAKEPAQQRLDSYKYPVLSLANEIITDIFLHILPTYPEPPPLLGPLSPTILTHICRQWREIALTTPLLWRAIDLRTPRLSVKAAASLAPLWLKRSGCLPLSIRATDAGGFSSVLLYLIPHRVRLEQLDLKLRDVKGSAKVLDGPSPLLRTLNVSLSEGGLSPPLLLPNHNLPRLCTVGLFEDQSSPSFSPLVTIDLPYVEFGPCELHLRFTADTEFG
ncbi:F-box domain-containing protein [Favolaschia claudopus]|uniref:F-box domain-containing protein n=1 Tax=Favolaschia claudopus TaxID=2862362 RepID=A0AAW0DDK2_9AGAR